MPTAVKRPTSKDDLYDALESAMTGVKIIMKDLKGIPEYQGWYDLMDDVLGEMKSEFEPLEAWATQEYADEMAELNRQYERDCI